MKNQSNIGSSSAKTHRLTQPSNTLNRRYVGRPTNLAIEEAARMADYLEKHNSASSKRPSRLVNLRVHNDDLAKIRAAMEKEAEETALRAQKTESVKPEPAPKPIISHKVVELGGGELPPAPESEPETEAMTMMPAAPVMTTVGPKITDLNPSVSMPEHNIMEMSPDSESVIDDISDTDLAAIESTDTAMAMGGYSGMSATPAEPSTPVDLPPIKNADIDTRALAMNIAADYTAATLGATMANLPTAVNEVETDDLVQAAAEVQAADSIDQIANTVANYVNKIRESKDPEEISLTIKDLKDYAEAIKQSSDLPEIAELGDTIEKFIAVTEKSTGIKAASTKKSVITPKVERAAAKISKSTDKMTLKSGKKIAAKSAHSQALMAPKAMRARQTLARADTVSLNMRGHHAMRSANTISARTRNPSSNRRLNDDEALRKTMRKVARMEDSDASTSRYRHKAVRKKGRVKRFILAFGCATACVVGIIYVVSSNVPDISVRVAAMQAGVDSSYPSYVPTEFSLSDIKSDDKEITLIFTNAKEQNFELSEKKSAWDSAALERNLVKKSWQDDYSTTHEQGITMYIHESSAAWVNGGVLYQITAEDGVLTKKQLRSIATSMQ